MKTATAMPLLDPYSTDPFPRIRDVPHHAAADSTGIDPGGGLGNVDPYAVDPQRQDPIRRAVTERLLVTGRRHTRHRSDRAHRPDRPGPHALLILLRAPGPSRADAVVVATRMVLDGPDVTDLPALLSSLVDRARDYGVLSLPALIAHLCDRVEPHPARAAYLGVAVSSVDRAREGRDPMPWDGIAHLVDGTRVALHATSADVPAHVITTHTLQVGTTLFELRPWQWATTATPAPDRRADLSAAHGPLGALHQHLSNLVTVRW